MISRAIDRIRREAAQHPAVVAPDRAWTYDQLAAASARIAVRFQHLAAQNVGVRLAQPPLALAALIALDRLQATAYLFPASTSADMLDAARRRLDLVEVLADENESGAKPGDIFLSDAEEPACQANPGDGRVVLFTSGTSGAPKPALHSWMSLAAAVSDHPRSRGRRWLLSYDLARFAGLQVALQSLLTGGALCAPTGRDPESVARCLIDAGVECASGTPTFWRMLLAAVGAETLRAAPLAQITLGGEAVSQPILDALAAAFPAARLSHIYASTEMGACFTVRDGRAGFPLAYLSDERLPCKLKIADDGELMIASRRAMTQYLDETTPDESPVSDGWFASGDLVRVEGDRVHFVGRRSECINVGGAKVYPADVEAVIRAVPGVREVRVHGVASSVVGELVAAEVQAEDHAEQGELRKTILTACRARLAKHQTPGVIEFRQRLAVNDSGKLVRAEE